MEPNTVFIGCPTHDGRVDLRTAKALYANATQKFPTIPVINQGSLLAQNCNELWAKALNMREKYNIKWFAMLHSDIAPEPYWIDKMIELAETWNADMLSAIVPIKDARGLTSTAISSGDESTMDRFNVLTRLTQKQIHHPSFPKIFDAEMAIDALDDLPEAMQIKADPDAKLLCNTGCMIARIDKQWAHSLYFTIDDEIRSKGGIYYSAVYPEDWFFSDMYDFMGGRVMATSLVHLQHFGYSAYSSIEQWGQDRDTHYDNQIKQRA